MKISLKAKLVSLLVFSVCLSAHASMNCSSLFESQNSQADNLRARLRDAWAQGAYNVYYGPDNRSRLELISRSQYVDDFLTRRFYWVHNLSTNSLVPLKADFENYDTNVFSADGKELRILENDGTPGELRSKHRVFSTETGEFLREIPPVRNRYGVTIATDYKLSTDFKIAVVRDNTGALSVLDVSTQQPRILAKLEGDDASLSPDGKFVVLKNQEFQVVYRLNNDQLNKILKSKRSRGRYNEIFSADGRYVFIKDELLTAGIYSLETGREVSRFPLFLEHAVNITPDGNSIILVRNSSVVVRDINTGQAQTQFELRDNYSKGAPSSPNFLRGLFFTPDSKKMGLYLISPSDRKKSELFIYDIQNEILEIVQGIPTAQ